MYYIFFPLMSNMSLIYLCQLTFSPGALLHAWSYLYRKKVKDYTSGRACSQDRYSTEIFGIRSKMIKPLLRIFGKYVPHITGFTSIRMIAQKIKTFFF